MSNVSKSQADEEYPISEEWLRDLRRAMRERGAQARLAREIGCSPGTLNELVKHGGKRSNLVAKINKAMGWPPPPAANAIMSRDTLEVIHYLERMGEPGRELMRRLKSMDKEQLAAMLTLLEQMSKPR